MKIVWLSLGIIIISFLILEGSLRLFFGLGKRPLYIADDEIGYLSTKRLSEILKR